MTRIYTPQALSESSSIALEKAASHHLCKVLRMTAGDALTVFNGDGCNYAATITATGKSATLAIQQKIANNSESPMAITLVQGISRGDRMDYALQKSVELGVSAIQTVTTEKSAVKLDSGRQEKKHQHWQAIIISACEQSGRSTVPHLHPTLSLKQWLKQSANTRVPRIVLDPRAATSLSQMPVTQACQLVIGPESGFSESEVQAMETDGVLRARLGPRILRTETASTAAIAVLQAAMGDFV